MRALRVASSAVTTPFIAIPPECNPRPGMFQMEGVMFTKVSRLAVGAVIATTLAGCVAPPPRPTTTYYDDRGGYYDRDRDCHQCGRVTDIERVYARDRSTSGGGAVIGAIVGGLLGS